MSDSVRPHRRQPTRLPRPWDSPGKNTGVGRHFPLQFMKVKSESEVAQSCPTPRDPMDCSRPGSSVHGILQVRILEWVAIFYSRVSSQPRDQTRISCIGKWCLFLFFLFDTTEPPGKHFYLAGLGKGLRRCMSNKILGNTDTVSLEFSS